MSKENIVFSYEGIKASEQVETIMTTYPFMFPKDILDVWQVIQDQEETVRRFHLAPELTIQDESLRKIGDEYYSKMKEFKNRIIEEYNRKVKEYQELVGTSKSLA